MLHEIFYWVINMSIIASAVGILIYFLRFIKGFPKFASYVLWAVVLVRFLCPLGITSEYSLLNLISNISENVIVKSISISESEIDQESASKRLPKFTIMNSIQQADTYDPITYKTNTVERFFRAAAVVWIIVAIAALLTIAGLYYLTVSELKKAVPRKGNLYEGGMVNTPTVYGIWKPKIILPIGISEEHLNYILAHEKVHIRRRDNVWRMLAILAACIHWFNPLSWIFLRCFLRDCEMACDEAAVKNMNGEERKQYALTLLAYASEDLTVFSSAFGGSKVKVRIKNVLSYRKLTIFSTVCFIALVITIALLLLTNAS